MNSPRRLEQDLPVLLEALYLAGTPDYRDDFVQQVAATRQRPAWTFLQRWLPMDITTQRVATPRMPWRAIGVLALIAVLLAATLAAYIGTRPRFPAPYGPAENGSIVYAAEGDVFIRDTADGTVTPLITGPATETWAVHSPLGDRLAVLREADGGEDLWVAAADGTDLLRVGGPYANLSWIDWSPDQSIVAISYERPGFPTIELVSADGSGSQRPVDIPAMMPTWRPPDGGQLLFRGLEDGRWSFFLLDPATGDRTRLAIDGDQLEGGVYDMQAPNWSPTGDRLAFHTLVSLPGSQGKTPGFRISVADVDPAGTVTDVTPLEFDPLSDDEMNPQFTPDGTRLVFMQRFGLLGVTDHTDALWLASADGSGPATSLGVDSPNGDGIGATIAPDGSSILATLGAESQDWMIDPVTGTATLTEIGSGAWVSWQRRAP